jgi:hypothetical protein
MNREQVLATVAKRGIRFIRLLFCDIVGFPKCVTITSDELQESMESGKGFDGSSIEGFTRIYESDMVAMPEPSTFKVLPWDNGGEEALMFCNVLEPDGNPYPGDPRSTLRSGAGHSLSAQSSSISTSPVRTGPSPWTARATSISLLPTLVKLCERRRSLHSTLWESPWSAHTTR